jgi:drug/metabolite transporter (DMT)-like permease
VTTSVPLVAAARRRRSWKPTFAPIGILAMLLAVFVFSSSSTIVKWADTPGSVLAFWRMIGAVTLWWLVIGIRRAKTGRPAPTLETWKSVAPAGLFFGLNITLFFTALGRTSIAHAEFITALSPLVLIPLGAVLFKEKPDRRAMLWGLLTVLGLAMVLFLGGSQGGATIGGDAIVIVVVCTWVGYLLTGRRARATVDVVDFMSTMMPIGVLTAAPVAIILAGSDMWPLSAKGWVAVVLLSVLTGMIGHGLIAFAQSEVDVGTIGVIQVAQPALAVCWSFLILGESIRVLQVPGMILVIVGLAMFTIISQRRGQRRAATVAAHEDGELAGPAG